MLSRTDDRTNSFLHELCGYSAVDASRNGSDNLGAVADKMLHPSNLLLSKVAHDPVWIRAANVYGEIAQKLTSAGSLESRILTDLVDTTEDRRITNMFELGVELHACKHLRLAIFVGL